MVAIAQDLHAIDKYVRHALAVAMRIAGHGVVLHFRRIEDGQIGKVARFDVAAIFELEIVGGEIPKAGAGRPAA